MLPLSTFFKRIPIGLVSLLLCLSLGCFQVPSAFATDYDIVTLKNVLIKLHLRYEESVKANVQLNQQVQQLKAQLNTSPQRTNGGLAMSANSGMSLVPQEMLTLQSQLAQMQGENKVLKQRLQNTSASSSSDARLLQASQELQKAVSTIQDQQKQIASLSDRIEALQSMQVHSPITLNGKDLSASTQRETVTASRVLGGAANITPLSAQVVNMVNQASELRKNGKWEAAQSILLKASSLAPEEATVYYNLGNVYAGQNNLENAIGAYLKAINLKRTFSQAYYNLGVVYQRLGDNVQAKKYLSLYLSLEPTCSNKTDVEEMIQSL